MVTTHLGDYSNHDWRRGSMDFAAMRRDGILGGSHKTTDGLNYYLDPYAKGALPQMRAAFADGVYGSYHVLWGNRDLSRQVDWWFAVLDDAVPGWRDDDRFFLMTDNEPFGYNAAPTITQVNQVGDLIAGRVRKVMAAYCPPWHYGQTLDHLRYPLVASNYGTNPAVHYLAAYPGPDSTRWVSAYGTAWGLQYGSRTVMGQQATCDANAVLDSIGGVVAALSPEAEMAGEADKAFSAPYTGDSSFVSPQSWMARAIELPLREMARKLDGLSGDQPAALSAEDRAAIVAELKAEIPTAAQVATELINQLRAS